MYFKKLFLTNNLLRKLSFMASMLMLSLYSFAQVSSNVTQTGLWSSTASWSSTALPIATDNITIVAGDTVTLNNTSPSGGVTINNLTIQTGGVLIVSSRTLNVNGTTSISAGARLTASSTINLNGNVTVAGFLTGNGTVNINGDELAGSGNISVSNFKFNSTSGTTTIPASALLYKSGTITINAGKTVVNNGNITVTSSISGVDALSTWTNGANSYLYFGGSNLLTSGANTGGFGVLNASATGNTIVYTGGNANIKGATYYNLIFQGTGTKTSGGNFTILNALEINTAFSLAGSGSTTLVGPHTLTLSGNLTGTSTSLPTSGTISVNGTGDQTIYALTGVNNLTINKSSGKVLINKNFQVRNDLSITGANLDLSGFRLTVGVNSAIPGSITLSSAQILASSIRRYLPSAWAGVGFGGNFSFPLSTASGSKELIFNFAMINFTGSTYIDVAFGNTVSPATLTPRLKDAADSIRNIFGDGAWTVTHANVSGTNLNYSLNINPTGFVTYPFSGGTERVISKLAAASVWSLSGTHVPGSTSSSVQRSGLTTLTLIHAIGSTNSFVIPAALNLSASTTSVCPSSNSVFTIDSPNATSTYTWTTSNGATIGGNTTSSGVNLNSVTVDFGAQKGTSIVNVRETTSQGVSGPLKTYNVSIGNASITSISGPASSYEGNDNDIFSVANVAGNTYIWSLSSENGAIGNIATGQNTNSVTTSFTKSGVINISVSIVNTCGTETLSKQVSVAQSLISTVAVGDFNDVATFDGLTPNANSNVILEAPASVTVTQTGQIIKSLSIEQGATFILGQNMTVTGNFSNDGTVILNGKTLTLSGINTIIAGNTGTVSGGTIAITGGTKTIQSTEAVNFDNLSIANSISLVNNGSVLVNGNLTGGGTFTNAANSTTTVYGNVTSALTASSTGNSFTYGGAGAQSVRNATYFNLNIANTGTKTVAGNITTNSDISVSGSAQIDLASSSHTVFGNWVITSSNPEPVISGTSTVTFRGTPSQLAGNGNFKFNNLQVGTNQSLTTNTTGTATITGNILFNGTTSFKSGANTVDINLTGASKTISGSNSIAFANLTVSNGASITASDNIGFEGNFTNNGSFTSTAGLNFIGASGDQTITMNGTVNSLKNLTVNKAGGEVDLGANLTLTSGTLTLTSGNLNGNSFTLSLPNSTIVGEDVSGTKKFYGGVLAQNTSKAFTNNNNYDFGNGISISNCGNCGTVTVNRGNTPQGNINKSIARYLDIDVPSPSGAYSATLTYTYSDAELNGQTEANFKFYKSTDAGQTWVAITPTSINYSTNTLTLTGISSFSRWTASNSNTNPVPVNIIEFNAQVVNNLTNIKWTTASEINNKSFTIEKSVDGEHFEAVGTVAGKGNTSNISKYEFTLKNAAEEIVFFRLKQVDFDGSFHYSRLISITNDDFSNASFSIFPNPVTDKDIFLQYNNIEKQDVTVRVFDVNEKSHFMETYDLNGSGVVRLFSAETNTLAKGVYFVLVQTSTKQEMLKLIVE